MLNGTLIIFRFLSGEELCGEITIGDGDVESDVGGRAGAARSTMFAERCLVAGAEFFAFEGED